MTTCCGQLKLQAADGKYYLNDVADTEQLLRFIQYDERLKNPQGKGQRDYFDEQFCQMWSSDPYVLFPDGFLRDTNLAAHVSS